MPLAVTVSVGKFCKWRHLRFFFLSSSWNDSHKLHLEKKRIVLENELSRQMFYNIQNSLPARVNCYHFGFGGLF